MAANAGVGGQQEQEQEPRPSTSRGMAAAPSNSVPDKDASMLMVLDVLMELRRGYVSLVRLMRSEQDRELAHSALLAIDEDIERVHDYSFARSPEGRTNQMAVFSDSVRRSRAHARLIRNMVHQTRLRYEAAMFESQVSGLPDAGGDDGGLARRMSTTVPRHLGPLETLEPYEAAHDEEHLAQQEEELQWLRRLSILFMRELNLDVPERWPAAQQEEQEQAQDVNQQQQQQQEP